MTTTTRRVRTGTGRRRPRGGGALLAGAEAWSSAGADGAAGVLLVHGYPGSPVSLRPLGEALAAEGFAVEIPRLPGHGTSWRDLADTRWPDWADEVSDADSRLLERAPQRVVVGLSNGGALALHHAAALAADDERPAPAGLVLVNPSVRVFHPLVRLLPSLRRVLPCWPADVNDVAKPGVDEGSYRWYPLETTASVLDLYETVRAELPAVTVPALVYTSRHDHCVEPVNSRIVLDGIASSDAEQVWLERSYHVATLDYDADLIAAGTAAFVRRVAVAEASA